MELVAIEVGPSPARPGAVRLTGRVRYDRSVAGEPLEEQYWFEYPEACEAQVARTGDPWLACLLPRAMHRGEPLVLRVPVDPRLLDNARERLAIWQAWKPARRSVPIEADTFAPELRATPGRTVSYFSGGVDSYFTALAPRAAPIDELLLVRGALDLRLEPEDAYRRVLARLQGSADALGKTLLSAATNVIESTLGRSDLAHVSLGSLMGAVALGLEDRYERVLMPASVWLGWFPPWGSHPLTDVLLSTSRTAVLCDGVSHSRMQKTAALSGSAIALASLRVCMRTGDETNCMTCEKCLRTAVALEATGALSRCPTLGGRALPVEQVERLPLHDRTDRYYASEVERFARRHDRPDLARAIARARRRSLRRELRRMARAWLMARVGAGR